MFKNFFKNNTKMTTKNTTNDEIVDQAPIENNEIDSDVLDSGIEERVEEISR